MLLPPLTGAGASGSGNASSASTANAINSATTAVNTSAATAPSANQVLTATGDSAATWQAPVANGVRSATTTVSVSAATAPTAGQVLTATSGTAATWQTPSYVSGTEIVEASITSDVTITSSTEGTPDDVISAGSASYDGTDVIVTFSAPAIRAWSATNPLYLSIWNDSTNLGIYATTAEPGTAGHPCMFSARITPSAGAHTIKVTGYLPSGGTNGKVFCGAGGTGNRGPASIRIIKA